MSIEIKVPELPESVSEATVGEWHKKQGDSVSRDENVVDLETDKVMLEVPAVDNGVITEIRVEAGDTVVGGDVLAVIEEGEAAAPAPSQETDADDRSPDSDADAGKGDSGESAGDSDAGKHVEIRVPELPESVSEATVGDWHKSQGDAVSRDENLVDLETDKVMLEVPAVTDGVVVEVRAQAGATVGAGDVLAVIAEGAGAAAKGGAQAAQSAASGASAQAEPDARAAASPAAQKLMAERGLSAAQVSGSGKDGRITKADVLASADSTAGAGTNNGTQASAGGDERADEVSLEQADREALSGVEAARSEQRVPMTRIRTRIAERLLEATQNTAMLTTFNEVDLQAVTELRQRYKSEFQDEHDVRLGFMSFFVKAAVEALKRFPVVNASIDDSDVVYHGYYDIGIAVSSPRGLLVPVLRNADQMSYAEVEHQIRDYGKRAQAGKITLDELTGGTFTITNGGAFGSLLSTPIINPPQSAILGMHGINQRPVVVDGEIVVRPMMYLAVSYDHRLIDGRDSVLFLKTIKEMLEDPARLLLQI